MNKISDYSDLETCIESLKTNIDIDSKNPDVGACLYIPDTKAITDFTASNIQDFRRKAEAVKILSDLYGIDFEEMIENTDNDYERISLSLTRDILKAIS